MYGYWIIDPNNGRPVLENSVYTLFVVLYGGRTQMARGLVVIQFLGGSNPLGHPMQRAIDRSSIVQLYYPRLVFGPSYGDRPLGPVWSSPFRCIPTHCT